MQTNQSGSANGRRYRMEGKEGLWLPVASPSKTPTVLFARCYTKGG